MERTRKRKRKRERKEKVKGCRRRAGREKWEKEPRRGRKGKTEVFRAQVTHPDGGPQPFCSSSR